ncbi:MAG: DUF883 family protein [Planctomycetaceae bacterium]|nr:DUF883 family protein [Planctomycetaceae bacterium]
MAAINSPVGKEHPASDRLREQAGAVAKDVQEMGGIARDAAQEKFGQMQENASELCDQGRDKVRQAARSLEQYIAEQPLASVLIAGGVGLLLGRFWMRR